MIYLVMNHVIMNSLTPPPPIKKPGTGFKEIQRGLFSLSISSTVMQEFHQIKTMLEKLYDTITI